jgi:hypothetical protein
MTGIRFLAVLYLTAFWGLVVLSYFKWHEWSLWMKGFVTIVEIFLLPAGVLEVFQSKKSSN